MNCFPGMHYLVYLITPRLALKLNFNFSKIYIARLEFVNTIFQFNQKDRSPYSHQFSTVLFEAVHELPTLWYVRPTKPQISLRIRAV